VFTNSAFFELQDIPPTRILSRIPASRLENRRRIQAMREQIEMFKRKRIEDGVKVSEITHQMTYDW